MKKELDYFNIEELYGGNQEIFADLWMRGGGCAAVTACDLSIYLDLYKGTRDGGQGLYPFDLENLTKESYERFAMLMKPYLRPRFSGIDKLDIYLGGFQKYLAGRGCDRIRVSGFSGSEPFEKAREMLISRIDAGFPVPMLNLRHRDRTFSDFEWHWFLLTGYECFEDSIMVKVVSYGEYVWFDFKALWNSGHRLKGGLIIVREKGETVQGLISGSSFAAGAVADPAEETDGEEDDGPRFGLTDPYLFERFEKLVTIDSPSHGEREMADCLKAELASLGIDAEEDNAGELTGGNAGNLYAYVKGSIPGAPILLSAHMDTASPGTGRKPVWDRDEGMIRSDGSAVLGADDAAGILEILEALKVMTARDLPHRDLEIVFTVAGEDFSAGAAAFDYQRLKAKEAYVFDLDGPVGSAVYRAPAISGSGLKAYETDLALPPAKHFREACGMLEREAEFRTGTGYSDLHCFAEHGIPGLVLSCGMQNVHTVSESIRIDDIRDAVMLILCLAIQEE